MAADVVLICNRALQLVKNTKAIASLTEGTKEANACETIYAELRDTLLEMHHWNFATKRARLARLSEAPAFKYDHQFQLPADFLRLVSVHPDSGGRGAMPYKIEGGRLLCDEDEVFCRYIARIADPNLMPATFRNALSKLMASSLATALNQSASLSDALFRQFLDQDLPRAKSADAIQDFADQLPESAWVAVRAGAERRPAGEEPSS